MNRCKGQCCERFPLPVTPEQLQKDLELARSGGPKRDPDIETIATMVVFLEMSDIDVDGGKLPRQLPWYRCSNHDQETGNCRIYETRPAMCSRYPYGRKCRYPGCEFDGEETRKPPLELGPLKEKDFQDIKELLDETVKCLSSNVAVKAGEP